MQREELAKFLQQTQTTICTALEEFEDDLRFSTDTWNREQGHGGGGISRVLRGNVFEQAGVNFSEVYGVLPAELCESMIGRREESPFYATGISLVIHPLSPRVPTTHANFRYLEVADRAWFGGGMDLTPYRLEADDAKHFHSTLKYACDRHDLNYYPKFKQWCDEYFFLPHRGETRGVGGIFFDYLGRDPNESTEQYRLFFEDISQQFLAAYLPIVRIRLQEPWTDEEREFQLHRRGRYVEFNLVYDRGTLFGLKTGGRTESILMSLPPLVRWTYDFAPKTAEQRQLIEVLQKPRDWVNA